MGEAQKIWIRVKFKNELKYTNMPKDALDINHFAAEGNIQFRIENSIE